MKKYYIYILFIFLSLNCISQELAHDLNCAVPADANNNDVVMELWCTQNWDTTSSIVYSLVTDTSGAFGITSDTLYIADNTKLHASKTHEVIFRITDGNDSETASIYVYVASVANSDNQYTTDYNDGDFTNGKFYWYYRDTTYLNHPEITMNTDDVFIGARGRGAKPKIITGSNSYAFNLDDDDSTILENLDISGNATEGVFMENGHRHKIRNCRFHGIGTGGDNMCIRTTNSDDSATIPHYLEICDNWFDSIGSEAFYGRTWWLHIHNNKMTNCGIYAAGGGDAIQCNCFAYQAEIDHNLIQRNNSKTNKGFFISSHNLNAGGGCGIVGYDASGLKFHHNRCIGKDSMVFGTTTTGDADTFQFNYLEMTGIGAVSGGSYAAGLKFDGTNHMVNDNIVVGFDRGIYCPSQSVKVYNCTFHNCDYVIHSTDNNTNTIDMKNCLLSQTNNYSVYIHGNVNYTGDYNLFDTCRFYNGSTHTSLVAWQSSSSADANSKDAEPLFSSWYFPGANSQAINNGTSAVGLTEDYYGNPIKGTIDIGAIELQGLQKLPILSGTEQTPKLNGTSKIFMLTK